MTTSPQQHCVFRGCPNEPTAERTVRFGGHDDDFTVRLCAEHARLMDPGWHFSLAPVEHSEPEPELPPYQLQVSPAGDRPSSRNDN